MSENKRILVVDDSQFLASILSKTLTGAGFQVTVAGDVRSAVQSLKKDGVPDLLIMDLNLPDMQGDKACEAIRKTPACVKLPIVLISGMSDEQLKAAVGRAGANGYLKKPFSPSSILKWIRDHAELLEVMEKERGGPATTAAPSKPPSPAEAPRAASRPPPPPPPPPSPAAEGAATRPAAPEPDALEYDGEPVAGGILVIEDSSFLRSVLQDTLQQAGYAVCLTATMANGTALLKRSKPGLILLDVNLPDMKGDEACAILKNIPECKDIAVILMTSGSEEALRAKAEASSADGYLRKPFTPATILEWLKQQTWVKPKGASSGSFMPSGGLAGDGGATGEGEGLIQVLEQQLSSDDPSVRAQAAYSLGEHKHEGALVRLRGMLRDPEAGVVADVLWALGEMRDGGAVDEVRTLLEGSSGAWEDANVRLRAVEALGKIGQPEAIKTIALCLAEGRPKDERIVAIQALADLGDATVREDLQRIMFEDESDLQSYARDALEKIAERS